MTRISRESSEKIVFWSFVCSLAVVVIHCGWRAEGEFGRLSIALFKDTLARMAVPFFFVCSGFFLAPHLGTAEEWRREVRKRLFSLGVPYVLWTLAVVVVLYLEVGVWMGIGGIGINPTRMPALAPLWYLRCLLLFVVLSPLFKRALDRFRLWPIVVAYAALLGFVALVRLLKLSDEGGLGGFLNFGFPVEGFFYFLCGMFLQGIPAIRLPRKACAGALALGVLLTAVRLGLLHAGLRPWVELRNVITPLVLVGLWGCFTPPALPGFLRGCAYPVYLMHAVVLFAMRCWDGTYRLACNPWLEFGLGIVIPIVFCNVVRRICPRVANLLFGGRC